MEHALYTRNILTIWADPVPDPGPIIAPSAERI
jgi:hypothetical protein